MSCISIAKNSMIKSRTKHTKIRYHVTREMVDAREVQLVYCSTEIADAVTKELDQEKFTAFVDAMMLEVSLDFCAIVRRETASHKSSVLVNSSTQSTTELFINLDVVDVHYHCLSQETAGYVFLTSAKTEKTSFRARGVFVL